ncbi:type III-B CRISPR module RAMP protein Cmr4 [Thermodesulfatator atlanticus]|uniref:type III-B CRISPR module RAMP protein Cmr4 n=1 Tax=Thermodesulfatator atlanticus TaxID=501497 RepID=UPI0003B32C34|nr:type III-B CRISPR module RAMP protein Cmr4 [Thermodesulfatator atlanticus]
MSHLLAICHCVSAFHPGAGVSVSHLDLPVQREKGSDLPMMQGSGFKGALRAVARGVLEKDVLNQVFGPEPEAAHEHAGAARFTDLRLLLFPVKSLKGIFTWISSPAVLARFQRELSFFGFKGLKDFEELRNSFDNLSDEDALVTSSCKILLDDKLVLEEFAFNARKEDALGKVAEEIAGLVFPQEPFFKDLLAHNLVIVSDTVMASFAEFSMEVVTRIKINPETGTVDTKTGALWNEENLPAESVLYGFVLTESAPKGLSAKKVAETVKKLAGLHQFGGNATVGRGLVRLNFYGEELS